MNLQVMTESQTAKAKNECRKLLRDFNYNQHLLKLHTQEAMYPWSPTTELGTTVTRSRSPRAPQESMLDRTLYNESLLELESLVEPVKRLRNLLESSPEYRSYRALLQIRYFDSDGTQPRSRRQLTCWKNVAEYLDVSEPTARRMDTDIMEMMIDFL